MSDRERWQPSATGPCLTIEGADVAVYVIGPQRYRVTSPTVEREIEGYESARTMAHRMALGLDQPS